MYSWVSLSQSFMMFYYSNLWECMLQKPLSPYSSHQWRLQPDLTREWKSGCAGFGIFERLWQTRVLENKGQLWSILSCVVRKCLCPKNYVFQNSCILSQVIREFLPGCCILFHYKLLQFECITAVWSVITQQCQCRDQNFRGNSFTRND